MRWYREEKGRREREGRRKWREGGREREKKEGLSNDGEKLNVPLNNPRPSINFYSCILQVI